jgi:hypothetical protein
MNADLKIKPPTESAKESFYNYVRYEVNAARQAQGLPMLDSSESSAYLAAAWTFFNKHGVLESGS